MFGLLSPHPGPRSTVGPLYQINLTFEWVGPSQPLQGIVTALLGTGTTSLYDKNKAIRVLFAPPNYSSDISRHQLKLSREHARAPTTWD